MITIEVIALAIPVLGVVAFLHARDRGRESAESRARLIRSSAIGLGISIVVAIGSWYVLPTNPESPAMLITYFMSWVVGGGGALLALLQLAGALAGTPRDDGGVK